MDSTGDFIRFPCVHTDITHLYLENSWDVEIIPEKRCRMTFFQSELEKILGKSSLLKNKKYLGKCCYGILDGDIRAKVEFKDRQVADNYSGIWVTILNRKEGPLDTVYLSFSEILGKKQVNNPNFREGVIPHIWTNEGKDQWYAYQPVKSDYRKLTEKVEDYLSVFLEMDITEEMQEGAEQKLI